MTKTEAIKMLEDAVSEINIKEIAQSALPDLAFGYELCKRIKDFEEIEKHVNNVEFSEIIEKFHPNVFAIKGTYIES